MTLLAAHPAPAQQVILPGGPTVIIQPGGLFQIQGSGVGGAGAIVPAPSVIPGHIDLNAPLFALAHFDPPIVRENDWATYRIIVGCPDGSIQAPTNIPSIAGMKLTPGASEQQLVMVAGKVWRVWTFNYRAAAVEPGAHWFPMPAFIMDVNGAGVAVPGADLHVTTSDDADARRPLHIALSAPARTLYVGESVPINVRVESAGQGILQNLTGLALTGNAVLVLNDSMYARQSKLIGNAGEFFNVQIETDVLVTPLRAGETTLRARAQATIHPKPDLPEILAAYRPLIESDPLTVNAIEVPLADALPGYTGAIGRIEIEEIALSTNQVRVGEPVTLRIVLRGEANLQTVESPAIPKTPGWQLMPPAPALAEFIPNSITVSRAFRYTLIPLNDQITRTPDIPFSYFDPISGSFQDLGIPGQEITVTPVSSAEMQALMASQDLPARPAAAPPSEPETLRPLAPNPGMTSGVLTSIQARPWFLLMQLIPGLALAGLLLFDRRRRFLEAHPEIVAFRRARRACCRGLTRARAAAAANDFDGFARAIVETMQALTAPRLHATPESVVASDITRLLSSDGPHNPDVARVRQLFAFVDSRRFGRAPSSNAGLLNDRLEIEKLIGSLLGQLYDWSRRGPYPTDLLPPLQSAAKEPAKSSSLAGAALGLALLMGSAGIAQGTAFDAGVAAYEAEEFQAAAEAFGKSISEKPSAGAYHNLGNAAWQLDDPGAAILAWERAAWLNPYQKISRENLAFARKSAQLDTPAMTWFEACSSWLPVNAWGWLAALSFWTSASLLLLPYTLRWRRKDWHQAAAAISLALFLLSIPGIAGVHSRAQRGVILHDKTAVRLTPTTTGEILTRLPAGTTARAVRERNGLYYIRTAGGHAGWVDHEGFHRIAE